MRTDPQKLRAWRERSKPLRSKKPIERKRWHARINRRRRAARHRECFGAQADVCRRSPCMLREVVGWSREWPAGWKRCEGVTEPHHEPPRSCGGKDKDTAPLCSRHHRERHDIGEKPFNRKYGVNIRARAAALHARVQERAA